MKESNCLPLILSILILFCCSEKHEKRKESDISFELQDSVMIDYTGMVMLCDYNSVTKRYLAFDYIDNTILEFSEAGEIVTQFNASKDDPNGFSGSIYGLAFLKDTAIVVQTRSGYFFYSLEGELIDKATYSTKGDFYTLLKFNMEVTKSGKLISLFDNGTGSSPMEKSYYQQIKHLSVLNLYSYENTNLLPYEEGSMYLNNSGYYYYYEPVFDLNPVNQNLYLNYISEKMICVYDTGFNLIQSIKTSPEYFKDPTQTPYNQNADGLKILSYDSYYHYILSNGSYTVLEYYNSFPETVVLPGSGEEMNNLREIHNKYYYEIFIDGQKQGADILLPEGKFGMRY